MKSIKKITICSLALMLFAGFNFTKPVSAAETGVDLDFSVNVIPSISVTIPDINISLTPNPAESGLSTQDMSITVGTNNPSGYTLTMSAETTDLTRNAPFSDGTYATIPTLDSLSGGYTEETFTVNRWGFKLGNNNYNPFASSNIIAESREQTNEDVTDITFATKADYEQPEGTYELTLSFAIVANPGFITMQSMDPSVCSSVPTTVIDSRDNTEYMIARLEDGNCWMLQNLKLGAKADSYELTSSNSDVTSDYTFDGRDTDGIFPYGTNNGADYTYDSNVFYCTGDYGCYYNWYTATAGSGTSATTSGDVATSICPKGWTLPTEPQFVTLASAYSNSATAMLINPTTLTDNTTGQKPGFLFGGYYSNSGAYGLGSVGSYWSRTVNPDQNGYALGLQSTVVNPSSYGVKYAGLAVRCVLKDNLTIADVDYLQNVSHEMIANTKEGTSIILKDKRDNQTYEVKKLKDGNIWMMENLRLGSASPITLTPADTNITANYTLPANSSEGYTEDTSGRTTARINIDSRNKTDAYGSKYGTYYNYCAASAGQICMDQNTESLNATQDICPKGWRLPTGGSNSEITALSVAYGGLATTMDSTTTPTGAQMSTVLQETLKIPFSGIFRDNSGNNQSSVGYLWSSTYYNSAGIYILDFYNTGVNPQANASRRYGLPVRCIMQ